MKLSTMSIRLIIAIISILHFSQSEAKQQYFSDISSPPGMYIWNGNLKNHFFCQGDGSPTVILQSGLGGYSLDWILVQPRLAKITRVCSYDRAGYGWSGAGTLPRSAPRIAQELNQLLRLSGEQPPFILAGHSFGGLINQFFAAKYTDDVAGLLLIDSASSNQFDFMEKQNSLHTLSPTGSNFVLYNTFSVPDALPVEYQTLARILAKRRKTVRALYSELRHFRYSAQSLDQLPAKPVGNMPVIVVSRGVGNNKPVDDTKSYKREAIWQQLQKELANNNNAPLLISSTNNHYIQLSDPDLIIDALKLILENIKRNMQ